jgi:hypothetical protein
MIKGRLVRRGVYMSFGECETSRASNPSCQPRFIESDSYLNSSCAHSVSCSNSISSSFSYCTLDTSHSSFELQPQVSQANASVEACRRRLSRMWGSSLMGKPMPAANHTTPDGLCNGLFFHPNPESASTCCMSLAQRSHKHGSGTS